MTQVDVLAEQILAGNTRALARGLSWVEEAGDRGEALLERLYTATGRAHIVGITGPPGSGKSTLTRALARAALAEGVKIGILAIDPSSPFSGGSILGDRIRMNDLADQPNIFIRSMATRGALGGLCRAAGDAIDLMDAAGKDLILVETVGVGQDEVDVMRFVHTVVLVSVPGLGDDIQTLKAGVVEIADVHVVNKADREGADRIVAELTNMLGMGMRHDAGWWVPIRSVVALREEGIGQVLEDIRAHVAYLKESGELQTRLRRTAETRVLKSAQELLAEAVRSPVAGGAEIEKLLERVVRRAMTPRACARTVLKETASRERVTHV